MSKVSGPSMILIMDGFGLNPGEYGNAVKKADTPNLDRLFTEYPFTSLDASGEPVGLPEGQMGNSEVGHLNIGCGRIVYQDLLKITNAVRDGSIRNNSALSLAMDHAIKNDSTLHLFGLLSDGGVHSHTDHLAALIDMAKDKGVKKLAVHCFLDGRDVPPRSAVPYIEALENKLAEADIGRIATVSGRYYAMDRDKRWDRVKKAYDAITLGTGETAPSAEAAVKNAYARGENDEFVLPTVVYGAKTVSDGDAIIMYNFRPDRAREITRAFVDPGFCAPDGFDRERTVKDLCYVCMTEYDKTMPNVSVAYPPEKYENTLGEYVSSLGLRQLRIAETEKYAHVTFFFNGGAEAPCRGEDRILVPSPKVATYDLQPEMSAPGITDKVLKVIEKNSYDMIILNFANADMVGHTGIFEAAVKAVETVDACVGRIADAVLAADGQILLTADHGNADVMLDNDGNPVTSHSTNPVPLCHIARRPRKLKDGGKLADIAPTLLTLMGIPVPSGMTGDILTAD